MDFRRDPLPIVVCQTISGSLPWRLIVVAFRALVGGREHVPAGRERAV